MQIQVQATYTSTYTHSTLLLAPILALPRCPSTLGSPVLEPDLDLALGQLESLCQTSSFRRRQVLRSLKRLLELVYLVTRKCGSSLAVLLAVFACHHLLVSIDRYLRKVIGGGKDEAWRLHAVTCGDSMIVAN